MRRVTLGQIRQGGGLAVPKATTVYEAAAVCDPDMAVPPDHDWYVDLSPHRGGSVAGQLHRAIKVREEAAAKGLISPEQRFAKLLLTGLRGAGKTTELNQLLSRLAEDGYFPVKISGVQELNLDDLTVVELLMSLVWCLHDVPPVGGFRISVPAKAEDDLNLSLASVLVEAKDKDQAEVKLQAELGLGASIPFYLKVKTALKSMLTTSTERSRTVKAHVLQRTSAFSATLNQILDAVQSDLHEQSCRGLVFLIDELDRLPPRKAEDFPNLTIAEMLFDLQSADLKAPRAHVVYTFPSQLLVSVNLGRSWAERPVIIPAVKIFDRESGRDHTPGYEALKHLVEARVDVARIFEDERDLTELIRFSGGYPRDLLRLVRYAANRTDERVGAREVRGACQDLTAEYDRLLAPSLLEPLAQVARHRRLPPDTEYGALLERNLVLTYWNDDEWADLHPAVRQARGYRDYRPLTSG